MANRNYLSSKLFSGHAMMVSVDCNFVVSASDSGGLGITSLRGPYIQNIFMHTSATPGAGSSNPATPGITITNPNPISGVILVQLQDAYYKVYDFDYAIVSPSSGSSVKIDNSAMTVGTPYTITTLGDATTAKWQSIGVPAGITPAVGVSFIASSNGGSANTSTSRVQATASAGSGVFTMEMVPSSNADLAPNISSQGFGAQLIFQCRDAAGALVAPAAGSNIFLRLFLSNSSVTVQGE